MCSPQESHSTNQAQGSFGEGDLGLDSLLALHGFCVRYATEFQVWTKPVVDRELWTAMTRGVMRSMTRR